MIVVTFFFGAFAELRKASIRFVMPVRPSVLPPPWNASVTTGRIFLTFDIWLFFEYVSRQSKFYCNVRFITAFTSAHHLSLF
jgi:hypothetical protein